MEDVTKKIKKIRAACLTNAKQLIESAKQSPHHHIRFHLAILALEEIGKMALATIELSVNRPERPQINPGTDDHIKKIFWALWGASFEKENVTKEGIDLYRGMASNLHHKRLEAIYVDPSSDKLPAETISKQEADNLIGLVEARIGMEEQYKIKKYKVEEEKIFTWFLEANDDPEKRKFILGKGSLDKLQEFQSSSKWIKWLYNEFQKSDEEAKKLLEEELRREKPTGVEASKPKWKIKIKFYSESHSIRPSAFKKWNEQVEMIKLNGTNQKVFTNRPDEILCEITLPNNIPVAALWSTAYGMARQLIEAFNIATNGFFWWYLPTKHSAKFYEEITDLTSNTRVGVERSPKLSADWTSGRFVLSENNLASVSKIFIYLREKKTAESLKQYTIGLSLLAKNDIHLEMWQQALMEFYGAMKSLLEEEGHLSTKENIIKHYGRYFTKTDNLERIVDSIEELQKTGVPPKSLTLTDTIALKWCCDSYFEELANDFLRKKSMDGKGNEKRKQKRKD